MKIHLTDCRQAPAWTLLQEMVRDATQSYRGQLTRINRRNGGVDYRSLGTYDLEFRRNPEDTSSVVIELIVE